ncbi:hypothetical protein Z517_06309 [Fonsecaea pedrosoi CBS 271.37]|uniref:Uncharacterized protein n=1 Tax=Fonsecaea pedrosoi CBS 271.37 TaxID=1442368 RepID=A0A0D2GMC6_9EURO|nr:uncharacterized protein Z517_06309 [Fonsecaea pedrosoi CBS 271.37]KIW79695.1 hypothetical protein Z517_06309 [Fonsecaea pedrosoi CBS 271.37]
MCFACGRRRCDLEDWVLVDREPPHTISIYLEESGRLQGACVNGVEQEYPRERRGEYGDQSQRSPLTSPGALNRKRRRHAQFRAGCASITKKPVDLTQRWNHQNMRHIRNTKRDALEIPRDNGKKTIREEDGWETKVPLFPRDDPLYFIAYSNNGTTFKCNTFDDEGSNKNDSVTDPAHFARTNYEIDDEDESMWQRSVAGPPPFTTTTISSDLSLDEDLSIRPGVGARWDWPLGIRQYFIGDRLLES